MATSEALRPPDTNPARPITFALVDHGLTSEGGHNLTYCRRVLAAASAQGLRVIAGVGATAGACDACAPILALFPRDVWKNNPAEGRRWHAQAAVRFLRQKGERLARAASDPTAGPTAHGAPIAAQGSSLSLKALVQGLRQDLASLFAGRANAHRFARELEAFILQAQLAPGDVVYLPTVLAAELQGLEHLIARSQAARGLHWRLMLRYAPQARSMRVQMAASLRRLHRLGGMDVGFSSDTEQLCRLYEGLCGAPFTLLPIPVSPTPAHAAEGGGPLVVGYFGDARDEKGFTLLPAIIRRVRKGAQGGRPIRFVVQTNLNTPEGDARTRAARLDLIGLAGDDLELVEGPLAPDIYQNLFQAAHIVVLPYEPSAYAERSSGILMEALTAGAPCVVTSGGWMATMIQAAEASKPAGKVVSADAQAIADAVLQIAADWPRYAQGARSLRERLRPRFDPGELVRLVMRPGEVAGVP